MNTLPTENQRKKLIMMKLRHTLTYAGSSVLLFAGNCFMSYLIVVDILIITAIIYTPYLINTLYKLKKWSWIIAFGILVLGPMILGYIVARGSLFRMISSSIALFMFYLFCWILRYCLHGWIEEIELSEMNFDE